MQFCVTRVILRDLAALVPQIFHSLHKITHFLTGYINSYLLIVKKPDVIQKNELYFCNQGSNVIQNQLSKSKHRLKSFVLQACVIHPTPDREL
jgi:hypothetical protein